jgi:ubiquinone/menaquinone biosynthesis C-methylase UbiE
MQNLDVLNKERRMAKDTTKPIDWKEESQRFNKVANLYETYRPSYPPELVNDIISLSGIHQEERILEVGSGTGIATRLFAQRGFSILCLEPGQNLINVASEKLKSYPKVSFERCRFENWTANQGAFDLLISAQAFHWVPQEVRFLKAASVLKQHGHLAIFWNMYPRIEGAIGTDLDQAYRKQVPETVKDDTSFEELIERRAKSLEAYGFFENVITRTYPWSVHYKTKAYLGLLNTYSDHLRLSEQRRNLLFEEIAEVIDKHGGYIEKPYLAALYMAQKK